MKSGSELKYLVITPLILFSYSLLYSVSQLRHNQQERLKDERDANSILIMRYGKRKEEASLLSVSPSFLSGLSIPLLTTGQMPKQAIDW